MWDLLSGAKGIGCKLMLKGENYYIVILGEGYVVLAAKLALMVQHVSCFEVGPKVFKSMPNNVS